MKVSLGMVPTVSSSWKISAVIPTYNRRDRLQRALDSVVRQSLSVEEIILVDDGSTDGTADFVRNKFPSVTVIEQENQGVSAARNVGIQAATTSWIAFLDSDDVWTCLSNIRIPVFVIPKRNGFIGESQNQWPNPM
jgi:glycosyltransferase involved in cell wall biosynthesis